MVEQDVEKIIQTFITPDYLLLETVVSPDGQTVLVIVEQSDLPLKDRGNDIRNRTMWQMNVETGTLTQLTNDSEDAHSPSWSPGSGKISYFALHNGRVEIWVMLDDSSEKAVLTDSSQKRAINSFEGCRMVWSPDGTKIAYNCVPNGSARALNSLFKWKKPEEQIIVRHDVNNIEGNKAFKQFISQNMTTELYVYSLDAGISSLIEQFNEGYIDLIDWLPCGQQIVISLKDRLLEFNVESSEAHVIYAGKIIRAQIVIGQLWIVRQGDQYEIGIISDGIFAVKMAFTIPGYEISIHNFSYDAAYLFASSRIGVSTVLWQIDVATGAVKQLTSEGQTVQVRHSEIRPVCFKNKFGLLYPYGGPSAPVSLQLLLDDRQISLPLFHTKPEIEMPKVEIIKYTSDGWDIEALLVLPKNYSKNETYPTLVYLHGGPEGVVTADYHELISTHGQSAAILMALSGYVVLLPNFRGGRGYGAEFQKELGDMNLMRAPFTDVIAGVDYLIDRGIADPNRLGLYGLSFGASLTAWSITQTNRFKAAAASCGIMDFLAFDRDYGKAFYAYFPHRLGNADPNVMWKEPSVYEQLSPVENISKVQTPTLFIETDHETRWDGRLWTSWAKPMFNGLRTLGVPSQLVYYNGAGHGGGFTMEQRKDYFLRIKTWFNHYLNADDEVSDQ